MTEPFSSEEQPARILHVAQPTEAGVPVVVHRLVAHQLATGREVAVACPPFGPLPRWIRDVGAEVLPWPARREPGPTVADETQRLARLVRNWQPDLVHLHSSKAGLAGRLAVRGRIPTLYQPHAWSFLAATGPLRSASLGWERLAARWTAGIACVSETERRLGERAGVRARWFECPNGVDLDRFRPASAKEHAEARTRLGLPMDTPVVLCVGRLSRQKGQDVLLRAWSGLSPRPGLLVLLGDGPDSAELAALQVPDVLFAGATDDVLPWYAAADVVVQPSRWEGASLSMREALACGLPVVATAVAGNSDIPGVGRRAVPPDDVAALRAAIAALLADSSRLSAEGHESRRIAEEHFGLDASLAAVDTAYAALRTH